MDQPEVPSPEQPRAVDVPLLEDLQAPPVTKNGGGWRTWLLAGIVAALVAGGVGFMLSRSSGGSSAAASSPNASATGPGFPGGARPGARGTVTKIDGSDITVETTDRSGTTSTVVVQTAADTVYTKSVPGAISDLKTGDNIVVNGSSSNGSVTATSINDTGDTTFGRGANRNGDQPFSGAPPNGFSGAPPANGSFSGFPGRQGQRGNFTIGQITAIDGSTITISSFNGDTVTVNTDASTTFRVMNPASLADVKVGDAINATGDSSNGVVTATAVRIGDAGFGPGGFAGGGAPPFDPNSSAQSGN